jgi:hypothetical protein
MATVIVRTLPAACAFDTPGGNVSSSSVDHLQVEKSDDLEKEG